MIEEVNEHFCDLTGHMTDQLVGRFNPILGSALHSESSWNVIWNTVGAGQSWRGEVQFSNRLGVQCWCDVTVSPVFDEEGRVDRCISIFADISSNKRENLQLSAAKVAADRANHAKTAFLANMSHEIRTPLNAVIGLAYLLEKTKLDDYQRGNIHKIKLAGNTLLGIVNDVLDLSKIEAGELTLESRPFKLSDLIEESVLLFGLPCKEKGLALEFPHPADLPVDHVLGDVIRVRQILINLLNNAIKFTSQGKISVRFTFDVTDAETVALSVEVSDTGIGIDEELQRSLFRPFTQTDLSTTRRFGGTGLGLSIVRMLAEAMNGYARVSSTLGEGSTFKVCLKLARDLSYTGESVVNEPTGNEPSESIKENLAGVRILLVDDSELNLEIARSILEVEEAIVVDALDGKQATDWLREHPNEVDVVLADCPIPSTVNVKASCKRVPGGSA